MPNESSEPKILHLTLHTRNGGIETFEVEGYRIGDPPGWLQLVYSDRVEFLSMEGIEKFTVDLSNVVPVEPEASLHSLADEG